MEVTRRECLHALAAGAATLSWGTPLWAQTDERRRPNVVLILCDDLGAADLGCYGASDLSTPHIDGLAARGVRFTQFYAGAPLCSASRAGLLTGRFFQRALDQSKGLRAAETTMAELFRDAGYRTALYGKWHLAGDPPDPNAHGFEDFLGHKVGAIDSYSHFSYWGTPPTHALLRNGEPHYEDGTFLPDILVRESCRFIEDNRNTPFFLFLSFNQPHYPMQPERGFRDDHRHIEHRDRRLYAANVASLDDKVGRVLDCLKEQGREHDTIVLFMSDHGHSDEPGGRGGSAGVLRGGKRVLFEGGIRVPCVVSGPGFTPSAVRSQPAQMMDWMPTLAAYCGIDVGGLRLDGHDLRQVISSAVAPPPHEALHWMLGPEYWAVREGRWKLIGLKGQTFLADLEADPGERVNLSDGHGERVEHLKHLHTDWLQRESIQPNYSESTIPEDG